MMYNFSNIILVLLYCLPLVGQGDLTKQIGALLHDEAMKQASVSLSVRDMSDNEVISIDAHRKLIPASSLKLLTTLTAFEDLGSSYTFNTKVGYTGELASDGTLKGDIIIIGSGDPTLGSARYGKDKSFDAFLSRCLEKIKSSGVKCIDGYIEVRTNVFSGQGVVGSWAYGDISNYYGAGAWGLNINENRYDLQFSPSKEGSIASIALIDPYIPYLTIESEVVVKDSKSGDEAYIYGSPLQYRKVVRGSIPYDKKGFSIIGAIPNPPLSFAMIMAHQLENQGVKNFGGIINEKAILKSDFHEIFSEASMPLSDIIRDANFESINMYCESMLRIMAKKSKNEGSYEKGIEHLMERLENMGIDPLNIALEDGSGLSPRNLINTSSFTQFLVNRWKHIGKDQILGLIPQTGVSGTVSSMLQKKQSQKKFFLKSGSMGGVLSYTGYFESKNKKWYAVSFISNNHSCGNAKVRSIAESVFDKLYLSL